MTIRKVIEFETNRIFFIGRIPQMPGCIVEGSSIKEALKMLKKAKRDWIDTCLFLEIEVPEPEETIEIVQLLPSFFPPKARLNLPPKKESTIYNFEKEKEKAKKRLKLKKEKLNSPDFKERKED